MLWVTIATPSGSQSRRVRVHRRQNRFVTSITPQSEDFPGWYNDVVLKAEMADYSPVRGCMVIRPYGYAIWESLRDELDRHIKRTGHENVYFPLFVPKSLLEKEAEHVEGFNPQVAWVTHAGGEELTEWLAIRPTSEAIIAEKVKDWVQSYRDLPLLFNLWNNVVRWELRTRLFLRTTEFLWQEAHTFHATEQEAADEVAVGLEATARRPKTGWRSRSSRAARPRTRSSRARSTRDAIESMMRDGKALQAGTSHMLGQNFAKAAGIEFLDRDNTLKNPYGTSWGFTTRMVGATVMVHGDDSGLVLPPNVAPTSWSIVPIYRSEDDRVAVAGAIRDREVAADVQTKSGPLRFKIDWRESRRASSSTTGSCAACPTGSRSARATWRQPGSARPARRSEKETSRWTPGGRSTAALADYQQMLFQRALDFREANTHKADSYDEFKEILDKRAAS